MDGTGDGSGDGDAAFAAWLAPHLPALGRISRAFAQGPDQHDLLQELMVAVWKARPRFEGQSAPATFVWRVAHNAALTWRRGETRRWRRGQAVQAEMAVRDQSGDDPQAVLLERLYGAIRALPLLDRSLILLSLEGAAYEQIASLHGLTQTNVGARLTRIRARLSILVKEDGDGL